MDADRLVDRLQQSRTGTGVRAKGCIDDLLSHGILAHCDPVLIPRQVAKKAKKKTGRSRGGWNPIYAPKRELYGSDENCLLYTSRCV